MRRPADWLRQAGLDLQAGQVMRREGHFEWACFLAQQAGEKALKAAHEAEGTEAWGHSLAGLAGGLAGMPEAILQTARSLDKHYIPTRYPNTHPAGAPGDLYTDRDAGLALGDATEVVAHVRGRLPQA